MLVCAILLKNIAMGCRNALLPGHLSKERFILSCSQNTCDFLTFFKSLAIQLHRDGRSEEKTRYFFHLYMKEKGKVESATFQSVSLNDKQTSEETLGINNILYDVDTVDGYFVGELSDGVCRSIPVLLGCYATTVTFTM